MTRDEAVKILRENGHTHIEASFREKFREDIVDTLMWESARDQVDGLVALGVLKLIEA